MRFKMTDDLKYEIKEAMEEGAMWTLNAIGGLAVLSLIVSLVIKFPAILIIIGALLLMMLIFGVISFFLRRREQK